MPAATSDDLAPLAIGLGAAADGVVYVVFLWRWPYGPCPWCSGQGSCWACRETPGRRIRLGARLVARLTHSTRI
jgi:hypothetical protein